MVKMQGTKLSSAGESRKDGGELVIGLIARDSFRPIDDKTWGGIDGIFISTLLGEHDDAL